MGGRTSIRSDSKERMVRPYPRLHGVQVGVVNGGVVGGAGDGGGRGGGGRGGGGGCGGGRGTRGCCGRCAARNPTEYGRSWQ